MRYEPLHKSLTSPKIDDCTGFRVVSTALRKSSPLGLLFPFLSRAFSMMYSGLPTEWFDDRTDQEDLFALVSSSPSVLCWSLFTREIPVVADLLTRTGAVLILMTIMIAVS